MRNSQDTIVVNMNNKHFTGLIMTQ